MIQSVSSTASSLFYFRTKDRQSQNCHPLREREWGKQGVIVANHEPPRLGKAPVHHQRQNCAAVRAVPVFFVPVGLLERIYQRQ